MRQRRCASLVRLRSLLVAAIAVVAVAVPLVGVLNPDVARPAAVPAPNPVLPGDWPDPTVLRSGDAWWAATTATSNRGMPVLTSTDLVHWTPAGSIFAAPPRWSRPDTFWAPALEQVGSRFVVYYSTRRQDGRLCIAVAVANAVSGPYADAGPLTCQPLGSIDPDPTVDEHGKRWLVWKEDGNSAAKPTRIWARRLTADGLHLIGPKKLLLANSKPWDQGIVEGPEVVRRAGWFYLFYSGGGCCSLKCTYALGVARSRSLMGPGAEDPRNPILAGTRTRRCPGHATFTQDAAGHWYVLYHAVSARARFFARSMLLDKVGWPGGWPAINGGHGPSNQVVAPVLAGQPVTG